MDIQKDIEGQEVSIDDVKEVIVKEKGGKEDDVAQRTNSVISESVLKDAESVQRDPSTSESSVVVYKTRFWILAIFFYCAFLTDIVWGTFGPIMNSAEFAFGWSDSYIAMLQAWAPLFSVLCTIPFNWTTQKFGLRVGLLISISLVTTAAGIRCITLEDTPFTYIASVASVLTGMGGCLVFSLPSVLSSTWFPAKERATATAVATLATQVSGAGMYFAPLIVRTPDDILTTDDIKGDIRTLMFTYFGMVLIAWLCTIIYYPKEPPTPPSISSSVEKIEYFKSMKIVIRNPQVMAVILSYIITFSIPICWVSVMNFSLDCIGISQDDSMWIAISACIVSSALAFVVAMLTDRFYGHLRISIIGLLLASSLFYLWFLLITEHVIIISSSVQVIIAIVGAISLQYAAIPLMLELAVELAYPCPENVVGTIVSFCMDSFCTIFFLLMIIPSKCYVWLSYSLLASSLVTVCPLLFVKEVYNRSKVDRPQLDQS